MRQNKLWGIIPAAGSGQRFSSKQLKQYVKIKQQTILEYSVNALFHLPIEKCVIAIHPDDMVAKTLNFQHQNQIEFCSGGSERQHSVLAALNHLSDAANDDWVCIHDAARPCLHQDDLKLLFDSIQMIENGVILASPVRDTLKRVQQNQIQHTVDRDQLWQAYTPQVFKIGVLRQALNWVESNQAQITDEASALELAGFAVDMIAGRNDNIKVTYTEDICLAEAIINSHQHQ